MKIIRHVIPLVSHACIKESFGSIPGEVLAWAFSRDGYTAAISYVRNSLLVHGHSEGEMVLCALKAVVHQMKQQLEESCRSSHFLADVVKTQAQRSLDESDYSDLDTRVATYYAIHAGTRNTLNEALSSRRAGLVFKQVKKSAAGVGRRILDETALVRPDGTVWIDVTLAPPIIAAAALRARFEFDAPHIRQVHIDFLSHLDNGTSARVDHHHHHRNKVPDATTENTASGHSAATTHHNHQEHSPQESQWSATRQSATSCSHLEAQVATLENQVSSLKRQLAERDRELTALKKHKNISSASRRQADQNNLIHAYLSNVQQWTQFPMPQSMSHYQALVPPNSQQHQKMSTLPSPRPAKRPVSYGKMYVDVPVKQKLPPPLALSQGARDDSTLREAGLLDALRRQAST